MIERQDKTLKHLAESAMNCEFGVVPMLIDRLDELGRTDQILPLLRAFSRFRRDFGAAWESYRREGTVAVALELEDIVDQWRTEIQAIFFADLHGDEIWDMARQLERDWQTYSTEW